MSIKTVTQVREDFGEGPYLSDWRTVEQPFMDQFAEATDDWDWMHTDPVRARAAGFDGTIAFGFWTLSMLTHFLRESTGREYPPGARFGYNYGLDRVRFLAPVPVGSRIRNRLTLVGVREKAPARFLVTTHNEVEIEGAEGPAMIADWLILLVYGE
ncbi:MAG: MaoC family dehydratase [Longimicrobiales bacterium]